MNRKMTPQLEAEISNRITSLERENDYMKDFFGSVNQGSRASGTEDGKDGGESPQIGTVVPKYFGAVDTFIANPSNVGIGILSRMIETDPTVLSSVQFKSLMMLSKLGEFQHVDSEIKEFVNDYIKTMRGPTWREACEGMSSNGGYGFSITEIIWGLNKRNQKVPVKLPTYHPSTICFEVDPCGNVTPEGVIQFTIQNTQYSNPNTFFPTNQYGFNVKNPFTTPTDNLMPYRLPFMSNYGLARIPLDKIIHHTNLSMLSFGSPYGKANVRTAHLAWQMKVFFTKQLGIAGKRQASPFLWGTAPQNSNQVSTKNPDGTITQENPIAALTSILSQREGDDAIVTGPESVGYKIQAITAQMDLNMYLAVLNWLDIQIFRSFLLPSLVMTDGSAGSRSLGDKHFQVVDFIAGEEAEKFGQTIINQLIKPSIEMNFGEQDDYGHFSQRPQSIEERERLANMFNGLATSGFMRAFDEKDGEFVRSSLHLPTQDDSFYAQGMPNFDDPVEGDHLNEEPKDKEEPKKDEAAE